MNELDYVARMVGSDADYDSDTDSDSDELSDLTLSGFDTWD